MTVIPEHSTIDRTRNYTFGLITDDLNLMQVEKCIGEHDTGLLLPTPSAMSKKSPHLKASRPCDMQRKYRRESAA